MIDLRANDFKRRNYKEKAGSQEMESHACMDSKYGCHLGSFLAVKIMGVKLEDKQLMASEMAKEVPLVIES